MQKYADFLSKNDVIMKNLIKKFGMVDFEPNIIGDETALFNALFRSIIGQQLSVKAASTIFIRAKNLLENDISPTKILSIDDESLKQVGLSKFKISYIKNLAEAVNNKSLNLANLKNLSDKEVINQLTKVKGIGKWTAEMFLISSLKRPDVFSFGDLGLLNAMKKLYDENLTKEKQEEITNMWKPYRTYASLYLWKSLDNQPK